MIRKKRRGDFAINEAISLLCIVALIVLVISVFIVINQITVLNTMVAELSRYIEIRGSYDSSAEQELERLTSNSRINATMSFDGRLNGTKIQMGDAFTITLKSTASIGIGGILKIRIPISVQATGRGEKLWK